MAKKETQKEINYYFSKRHRDGENAYEVGIPYPLTHKQYREISRVQKLYTEQQKEEKDMPCTNCP